MLSVKRTCNFYELFECIQHSFLHYLNFNGGKCKEHKGKSMSVWEHNGRNVCQILRIKQLLASKITWMLFVFFTFSILFFAIKVILWSKYRSVQDNEILSAQSTWLSQSHVLTRTSCRFGQINNSFDRAFCCIDLTLFPVSYETGSIKSVFSHFFALSISLFLSLVMLFPIKKSF